MMLKKYTITSVILVLIFNILPNISSSSIPLGFELEPLDYLLKNLTRTPRQSECGPLQYKCKAGGCISEELVCDGKDDCRDGSDETETECKNLPCLPFLFKCSYGACINGDFECDGKQDCKDNSDETSSKCSKVGQCGENKYMCKSGQCIKEENLCDGKKNCDDGSDETIEACGDLRCPGFTYQCAYGACVSGAARCNGQQDCLDGSDERGCPITATPKEGCSLPNFPQYGTYEVTGLKRSEIRPGTIVDPFTVLTFSCQNGYKLYPYNTVVVCFNLNWDKTIPECRRTCSSLTPSDSVDVECTLDNITNGSYCIDPVEGTLAKYSCKQFYEEVTQFGVKAICRGGSWSKPPIECRPACGKRRGDAQTNIVGGDAAEKHDFPWHVGLYKSSTKQYLCGGSVINRKTIITAAHCVSNPENGTPYPKENYLVAAGKYYSNYSDARDKNTAQFPKIKTIHVYPEYRGEIQQHFGDIALIELSEPLKITAYIQPVCIHFDLVTRNDDLLQNQTGWALGWGFTREEGGISDVLKVLQIPYLNRRKCYELVSNEFKPFITADKLCAGYENSGRSVCRGDSGGGLVFKEIIRGIEERYYIRAIVSVSGKSKTTGGCDSNQYAGFTDLSYTEYVNFIREL